MIHLVIDGIPRTKKTSSRIFRHGARIKVMPSAKSCDWETDAIRQIWRRFPALAIGRAENDPRPPSVPLFAMAVHVRALFYREAKRGDLTGYEQAVADALERAGVIRNDSLIESWDGTRKLIDRARPRCEITLGPIADQQPEPNLKK